MQRGVGGPALILVLNYDEAGEAVADGEALTGGAAGEEETAQRHAEVSSF